MNGSPDLDRDKLTSLFDDLSRELEFARTRVQIYVIGGAAMSMAFDRGRTTKVVDAKIDAGHGALMKAVEKVARTSGSTPHPGARGSESKGGPAIAWSGRRLKKTKPKARLRGGGSMADIVSQNRR